MEEVILSIIMPVYNAQDFLKRSIESVLNQTYKNYELILVNDGSTDNSLSVCQYYSNKFSNVTVVNQSNQGVSAARNTGLDIAKGKYILFIDSDDYLYDYNVLDSLYRDIIDNKADCFQFKCFSKNNESLSVIKDINSKETLLLNSYGKKKLARGEVWNYIFNKDIINYHKLRFTVGLRVSEDQAFVYSYLSKCCNIRIINIPTYVYNLNNSNSCTKNYDYKKDLHDHILATSIIISANRTKNKFISERIAMMILHIVYISTKLTIKEVNEYKCFFRENIKFDIGYILNNKFLFVLSAFIDLRLSRTLYKNILR